MTWLVAAFLIAHGAIHLAVWLPPAPTEGKPEAPFAPDHSAVLTSVRVSQTVAHVISQRLAWVTAVAYIVAGLAVALGSGWTVALLAAAAAVLGLGLKAVFFNPWLSVGILLDAAVLTSALWSWPLTLG